MIDIPPHNFEPTLIAFAREWLKLMATKKEFEACALIDEPNSYGIVWTPARIRQAVEDAFGPGSRFRAEHPGGIFWSDPGDLLECGNPEVHSMSDRSSYSLEHLVPLNGKWSDLTAQFEFRFSSGGYSVVLHDLHVL